MEQMYGGHSQVRRISRGHRDGTIESWPIRETQLAALSHETSKNLVGRAGLEPATPCVSCPYSLFTAAF